MNRSHDQHDYRQELSLGPAPAVSGSIHTSDVYRYTMSIAPGSAAGAPGSAAGASVEDESLIVVSAAHLQKIKETVSEVEVAPGITVGDLALADYKFITTQFPPIDDHEQLQDA